MMRLKRILPIIMVLLVLFLCSVSASAADVVASGTCGADGDNLTWTLDADGVLTISGTGKMKDYSISDDPNIPSYPASWYSYRSSINTVVIENGVTSIGNSAFYSCRSLTSISIPDSVTSIRYYAFFYCNSLTAIVVGENNPYYTSQDGVLFDNDIKRLICCPGGKAGDYAIPDGVTSIDSRAFYRCSSLTSVEIPGSVTSIGSSAFYGCSSLTSVEIPDSVTSIGSSVFGSCSSLTSISIPNGVTIIDSFTFHECSSLTSISIPDSVTSIDNRAFWGTAYYNNEANWEDGVLYIDNRLIATKSSKISGEYAIKPGTKMIAGRAFYECSNLTSISIPDSVTIIDAEAFYDCDTLASVSIGNGVTSIGSSAFYSCRSLTSIEIPDSVTSIGGAAFSYCSSLTSIEIPDSVTSIGSSAFYRTAYYNDEANWEDEGLYIGNHLLTLKFSNIIKPGTKTIADRAFADWPNYTSIKIPDSVTSIGSGAFDGCYMLRKVYYSGSRSDWGRIEISENNQELLYADIIFGTKDDIELANMVVGTNNCSFEFEIAEEMVSKGRLFAAVYDAEGILIGVSSIEANMQNLPLEVEITGVPANCKAFLWESMNPAAVNGNWEVEN